MSVTAAAGFRAAGAHAGIKPGGEADLALVAAAESVPAAAVLTRNRAAAAPVVLTRRRLTESGSRARAVVINSGCANAATGPEGMAAAEAMTGAVAEALGARPEAILVCSTGPIGTALPRERVTAAVAGLVAALDGEGSGGTAAADAILTTDRHRKEAAVAGEFTVGGMAKGAGMLRPDMATMLAILTTDAVAAPGVLGETLSRAVEPTFNALDIDGCESTNDTVILLASGSSGVEPHPEELAKAVEEVCAQLAGQLAADAEGASRVVTIEVSGAPDRATARALARAVADSALVRASFYGGDPNWGRVVSALGAAGIDLDPDEISVAYAGIPVAEGGMAVAVNGSAVTSRLTGDFAVAVEVGAGAGVFTVVTTDLTPEYVRFNGARS